VLIFIFFSSWLIGGEVVFVPDSTVRELAIQMDKKYYNLFRVSFGWIKNADTSKIRQFYHNSTPIAIEEVFAMGAGTNSNNVQPVYAYGGDTRKAYRLTFPMNWNDSVNSDPTWQLWFQSLTWLRPMLNSNSRDTLVAALSVVNDWIGQHLDYPVKGEIHAWGDHAPAERVVVMVEALQILEKSGIHNTAALINLRLSILTHLFFLASLEKYLCWHNHAIIFDEKLISALEKMPDIVPRKEMLNLAFQRLFEQYRYSYTNEGVHKEHSPCYHINFSATLIEMIKSARRLGIAVPDQIQQISDKSLRFSESIRKMGSNFPVGDCARNSGTRFLKTPEKSEGIDTSDARFDFSFDFFPQSGWVFARENRKQISFCAQSDFNSLSHYQRDEGSFTLTIGNQELIIDPGLYSYERSPVYDYYRSARAHNMLVAEGLPDLFDLELTGMSGITRYKEFNNEGGPGMAAFEMANPHYRKYGVDVHRQYAFTGQSGFMVRDVIESDKHSHFRQLFHLWPGAHVHQKGTTLELTWENINFSLVLNSNFDDFRLTEGEKDSLQGWYFPGFNQMAPAPVLELRKKIKNGNITTIILIKTGNDLSDTSVNIRNNEKIAGKLIEDMEQHPRRELIHSPYPVRWRPER
jgi:hypothetical protein